MDKGHGLAAFGVALSATVAIMAIVFLLPDDVRAPLIEEDGVVETASAVLLILSAVVLLRCLPNSWPAALLLAVMALREFDMDKKLFSEGLFMSRQYVSPDVGGLERLLAATILFVILLTLYVAFRRGVPGFLNGIRARRSVAWTVALAAGLAVFSKSIDGLGRKLEPFGITIADTTAASASVLEETAEFSLAFAILLACLTYFRSNARSQDGKR